MLVTTYQKRSTPYWLNYIYSGQMFNFYDYSGAVTLTNILIVTSNLGRIFHMITREIVASGGGDPLVRIYEGTTTSNDGTLLTSVTNFNRQSTKTPDTIFYRTPTITDNGTLIDEIFLASTNEFYNFPGVYSSGLSEMVFKKNSKYLLSISVASAVNIHTNIDFFESGN